MLKIHLKFLNIEDIYSEISIIGTNDSLKNLNKKEIKQYFIDGSYKVLPNLDKWKVLVIITGNKVHSNDNYLCCVILMNDEKEETYVKLYNELKINYNFIPNFLTCDFSMSNINEINKIYKNDKINIIINMD